VNPWALAAALHFPGGRLDSKYQGCNTLGLGLGFTLNPKPKTSLELIMGSDRVKYYILDG